MTTQYAARRWARFWSAIVVITRRLLIVGLLAWQPWLTGCSNRALYDNFQRNHRQECLRLPETEYEQCMAETEQSFKAYQREREEILNAP